MKNTIDFLKRMDPNASEELSFDQVIVFGAGCIGARTVFLLERYGLAVTHCFDNNSVREGQEVWNGIRCEKPTATAKTINIPMIIAVADNSAQLEIRAQCDELGYQQVYIVDEDKLQYEMDAVPDRDYLMFRFYERMGKHLNLEHPHTFNEKLQWLKLYDRRPEYTMMADKLAVKRYVAERVGRQYVVPLLGVFQTLDEIDLSVFPKKFVIKCNHDSGSTAICEDRDTFDLEAIREQFERSLLRNYFYSEREFSYKNIAPKILVEQYLEAESPEGLMDYKVFTFNGEPKMIQVDFDRFHNHKRNMYTIEWEYCDFSLCFPTDSSRMIPKPACLDEMLAVSRKLAAGIPHVRVDFYYVLGHLYFGEMTFYHGSGNEKFTPDSWDELFGSYITCI